MQKANYAVRLYLKLGFEIIDENQQEYIMHIRLLSRNIFSEYGIKVACDRLFILYRAAVYFCDIVPQRRERDFISEIKQH